MIFSYELKIIFLSHRWHRLTYIWPDLSIAYCSNVPFKKFVLVEPSFMIIITFFNNILSSSYWGIKVKIKFWKFAQEAVDSMTHFRNKNRFCFYPSTTYFDMTFVFVTVIFNGLKTSKVVHKVLSEFNSFDCFLTHNSNLLLNILYM